MFIYFETIKNTDTSNESIDNLLDNTANLNIIEEEKEEIEIL